MIKHRKAAGKGAGKGARKGERGSALLIVLWMLMLVAAIAVSMSGTTRVESRLAFNLVEEARARHLAQAGINHAILALLDPRAPRQLVLDGSAPRRLELFGTTIEIRVRDECGKVDLNTAWGGLIGGLLAVHGKDQAPFLDQAILDWRDPDKTRRIHGAEDDDYEADDSPYGARDGLFEAIEELQQVRGMTEELYRRLAPDITVDCLAAGIDPLAASPAVLAALPGMNAAALESFLRVRRNAAIAGEEVAIPAPLVGNKFVEPSLGDVYSIESTAETASGSRVAWQAVVWLTGDPRRSFVIRSWRRVYAPPARL